MTDLVEHVTENPRPGPLRAFLAGMQNGMLGILAMLAWMGVSAAWEQRSFWTAENLMASAFYGPSAVHAGFAWPTIAGLALYLALYTLLGGLVAWALTDRLPRMRTVLAALLFALGWYYLSFHVLWTSAIPLLALLHVERTTTAGHAIYGLILGLYPERFAPKKAAAEAGEESGQAGSLPEEPMPVPTRSASEPDPASQSESF